MEKIAANTNLSDTDLRKLACAALATSLASPVIGAGPDLVKSAAAAFKSSLEKAAARHAEITDTIRRHVEKSRATA